jgi:hypothetical protein
MEKDGRRHVVWCLDGKNYASWKFGMKLALQSDELWEVVNGTQRQPAKVSLLMIYFLCVCVCDPCLTSTRYEMPICGVVPISKLTNLDPGVSA